MLIADCNSLTNWTVDQAIIAVDPTDTTDGGGSLHISPIDITRWTIYANYNPPGAWDLSLDSMLKLFIKTSSPGKPINLGLFSNWTNLYKYVINTAGFIADQWTEVLIDLTKPTTVVGTPSLSSIDFLSFEIENRGADIHVKIDDVRAEAPTGLPLALSIDGPYVASVTNPKISIQYRVFGGIPPYTTTINWGDGTSTNDIQANAGTFTVTHTYPGVKTTYTITANVIDSAGTNILAVDTTAIINPPSALSWQIRSVVCFPYDYKFSLIGTGNPLSFEVLLDELIKRFGDPISGVVNTIDVRVYWTNDGAQVAGASPTTPKIYEGSSGGESSFQNVAKAIGAIRGRGFKVLLGLVREWQDGTGKITDARTWLTNYKTVVVQVAQFAQQNGVDYFHMGWEDVLNSFDLQNGTLDAVWKDIILAVRSLYMGLLAYELNFGPTTLWYGEAGSTKTWIDQTRTWENTWWRDLDYLAVSCYPGLSVNNYNPTVDFLINAWVNDYADIWAGGAPPYNIIKMLADLSAHYQKKLSLNSGYPSCDGANIRPWSPLTSKLDWQEQADCWEAYFKVWNQADFLIGVDVEHFTKPFPPKYPDVGWEFQYRSDFGGKPAESIIKYGFMGATTVPLQATLSKQATLPDPLTIQFSGFATGGSPPYTWLWDFGDGTTSTEQNPTHAYPPTPKTYVITLTVTDSVGAQSTATVSITSPIRAGVCPAAVIATCIYGPSIELGVFRSFRDDFMARNSIGRWLTRSYYAVGQYLAKWLYGKIKVQLILKGYLNLLVQILKSRGYRSELR